MNGGNSQENVTFLTPGSGSGTQISNAGSRIWDNILKSIAKNFWVKYTLILCHLAESVFLFRLKNNLIFNFFKFMATKKGKTTNFPPSSFLLLLDPGPGLEKNLRVLRALALLFH